MQLTQPTIHHVLYVESDTLQIAKYGFMCQQPKSIWLELEYDEERERLDCRLAELHKRGSIKLYLVNAYSSGDEYTLEELFDELDTIDRMIV